MFASRPYALGMTGILDSLSESLRVTSQPAAHALRRSTHEMRALKRVRVAPSLPWIGALPPCPPAISQPGSLLGSTSYGVGFGRSCDDPPVGPYMGGCRCPVEAVKHEWASSWCPTLRRGAGHSPLTAGPRARPAPRFPGRSSWPVSRGRRCPPPVPLLCGHARRSVTVLRPERGGRSSGCLSGTLRRPPSSESHRAAPTPRPASLPCALPSRPGDEPHGWRPRASEVGRTVTVALRPIA